MKNVIMVLLDGTRQDRVERCPELLSLSKKGIYFSNMITAAPYTLSSLHSILSGIYPSRNGVNAYYNMYKFKKERCKILSEYLTEKGYITVVDVGNDSIIPSQGFSTFTLHDEYKDNITRRHLDIIRKTIIENKNKNPFFIFYQYDRLHSHAVLNVGKKFNDFSDEFFKNTKKNIEDYNNCLKETDSYVKAIMRCVEEYDLLRDTIIIFFSDHGMSNGEKSGEKMYGSFLYDYTIKVFSIIISPGSPSKEITFQTRTIDLLPTILEYLQISPDSRFERIMGQSLIPFINDKEKDDRVSFSETGGLNGPWPSPREPNVKAVRYHHWKLIHNETPNTWELYNLAVDPNELVNIYGNYLAIQSELKNYLLKIDRENNTSQH